MVQMFFPRVAEGATLVAKPSADMEFLIIDDIIVDFAWVCKAGFSRSSSFPATLLYDGA